jgi:regulatory protein
MPLPIRNRLSPDQAWQKIKHYCAYQERCHQETKDKLYGYGLGKTDVEQLLSRLIEEDFLNETRFAAQFAGGHFRMKQWGRVKIVHALQQKKVSSYNIKSALKVIDEADYRQVLQQLATRRWELLKGEQYLNRQAKTSDYLLRKGFEAALVQDAIRTIRGLNRD